MHFFTKVSFLLAFYVSLWGANIGNITALSGHVSIERGSQELSAVLGASIQSKDTIVTAKNGKAQLTFQDNTIVTIGKGSRFSLEEYLFDTTPNSHVKFNMIAGTIRAMTGKIGKIAPEKFIVKTKTATIGIRGTDFIVHISLSGEITILCMQGSIVVRSADGLQMIVVPAGSYVVISADGAMGTLKEYTAEVLNKILEEGFALFELESLQKMGIIHSDESLDRGAAIEVESVIRDIGTMIQTETIVPSPADNPQLNPTQDTINPTTGMP